MTALWNSDIFVEIVQIFREYATFAIREGADERLLTANSETPMAARPVRKPIDNPKRAWSLARAIMSDICLYDETRIISGIEKDNLFDELGDEIDKGRELFKGRVTEEIYALNIYDRSVVDNLVKKKGEGVKSKIW